MPYTFSFSDTSVIFTFYLYFFVVDSEFFFFFKQKTAYEWRISDWSSDVCSSELVESASLALNTPAARLIARGEERFLLLDEVEALQASRALVVDACRHVVRDAGAAVSLARRPVLFALARALGEAWPGGAPRDLLVASADARGVGEGCVRSC